MLFAISPPSWGFQQQRQQNGSPSGGKNLWTRQARREGEKERENERKESKREKRPSPRCREGGARRRKRRAPSLFGFSSPTGLGEAPPEEVEAFARGRVGGWEKGGSLWIRPAQEPERSGIWQGGLRGSQVFDPTSAGRRQGRRGKPGSGITWLLLERQKKKKEPFPQLGGSLFKRLAGYSSPPQPRLLQFPTGSSCLQLGGLRSERRGWREAEGRNKPAGMKREEALRAAGNLAWVCEAAFAACALGADARCASV